MPQIGDTGRRGLLASLLALGALAGAAPAAGAATYTLRPDALVAGAGSWGYVGPSEWAVLDDAVAQPALPSLAGDYLAENGNGPRTVQLGLSDAALGAGETVDGATAWAYLTTGTGRSLTINLRTASATLATQTVPAGSPGGWHSLSMAGSLTQGQVDDLRLELVLNGTGASSAVVVFAAYVDVATTDPPADDPPADDAPVDDPAGDPVDGGGDDVLDDSGDELADDPGDDGAGDEDAAEPDESPLDVLAGPVFASASGSLPIKVACAATSDGCAGTITIEAPTGTSSALRAARRVNRRYGRARYKLAPGQSRTVPIRLDRRASRKFRGRRAYRVDVVTAQKTAAGSVVRERRTVRVYTRRR